MVGPTCTLWPRASIAVVALAVGACVPARVSRAVDATIEARDGETSGDAAGAADAHNKADGGEASDADMRHDAAGDADATRAEGDSGTGGLDAATRDGSLAIDECAQPAREWLFCDGFEHGGTAPFWDGSDTLPRLLGDPGPLGHAGNTALQLRVPTGTGGAGIWKGVPGQSRLYARYYVYWEPGYDLTAPHHGPGGLAADPAYNLGRSGIRPDGTDLMQATIEAGTSAPYTLYSYTYYAGMYQDCADPNGSCWGDSFPCSYDPPNATSYCTRPEHRPRVAQSGIETGRWYCLEQMIDLGTPTPSESGADGQLDFWIDGIEIGPWSGLWLRSSPSLELNTLWLFLYFHQDHSVEGLRVDDVVISSAPIGCR
ncbi:MAG: hypothetical protein IT384_04105 [Deltaproteobacteria bacterium]|nr:hypothetical protein [Deltaproteobacteria bacterium]